MLLIDEMYAMYRNHLAGDEEDVLALVMGLFMDHSKQDLLKMIQEMSQEEVLQMVTLYAYQMLRLKMAREGLGATDIDEEQDRRLH